MANGLLNLGGGVQMANPQALIPQGGGDPTAQVRKVLTLQNLIEQRQDAPLKRRRLQLEIEQRQRDLQAKNEEMFDFAFTRAAQGLFGPATEVLRQATGNQNIELLPHPDSRLNQRGVYLVRSGDQEVEINAFGADAIKNRLELDKEAQKIVLQGAEGDRKLLNQTALRLGTAEGSPFRSPREALDSLRGQINTIKVPVAEGADPISSLNSRQYEEFAKQKGIVESTIRAGEAVSTDAEEKKDFRKLRPVPPAEVAKLSGGRAAMLRLNESVLPALIALQEAEDFGVGPIKGRVSRAKQRAGIGDKEERQIFTRLASNLERSTLKDVLKFAGTTFTFDLQQFILSTFPGINDDPDTFVSKYSVIMAGMATDIVDTMRDLATQGYNVQETAKSYDVMIKPGKDAAEKMFQSREGSADNAAAIIFKSMPDRVKKDAEFVGKFTKNLPPTLQQTFGRQYLESIDDSSVLDFERGFTGKQNGR